MYLFGFFLSSNFRINKNMGFLSTSCSYKDKYVVKIRAYFSIIKFNLNENNNKSINERNSSLQCAVHFVIKASLPTVAVIQLTPKN